ncbi:kinase-like protein [Decorospora gaudefroyi]|uniref:non-specific serine/threonine protein kinase n=1 Tax=Decorospora gaudefroyi TaxID=184978 RepID=A0A6A5KE83_9PLEO|nr:kinase-like protein [Decorospora gaudefroyi]
MDLERCSIPTHLQYTRLRRIPAVGNYHAAIWLLRHNTTRKLAIRKEFKREDVRSGFATREITNLRRLRDCYNVCTYGEHELNIAAGTGALVMRVYEYGDLMPLLQRHIDRGKKFPEAFVWHVLKSLADALLYMQRGYPAVGGDTYDWIVHRDVYPRNIFLGLPSSPHLSWPQVVLGDFGSSLSRADAQSRQGIELRQQRDFSSPDQLFTRRADVYQLGLVIVALCRLTVRPKLYCSQFGNSPAGSGYTPSLNNVLSRCLVDNPWARVNSLGLKDMLSYCPQVCGGGMYQLLLGQPIQA